MDIKDFYLNNPTEWYEYMRIPIKDIPQCIMEQYQLADIAHNGYVLVEIRKGMYGLPQAGIIANTRLAQHLKTQGYSLTPHTPGLFTHETRPITFCLVVDDFGVKYIGKEHAEHLAKTLEKLYTITTDWKGELYCGLTLKWDYVNRTVDVSMPGYVSRALTRFSHPEPTKPQHAPHAWTPPSYGTSVQLTDPEDTSPLLDAKGTSEGTFMKTLCGLGTVFLCDLGKHSSYFLCP
jgi:hypothetical protein